MKKIASLVGTGVCLASFAGLGTAMATSASADGGSSAVATIFSAAPNYAPTSIHDAYPGGYASETECEGYAVKINRAAGMVALNTYTTAKDSFDDQLHTAFMPYASNQGSTCWKLSSGKWTYGSVAFTPISKAAYEAEDRQDATAYYAWSPDGSIPSMTYDQAIQAIGGYHSYTPTSGALTHNSAIYTSIDDCNRYEASNIKSIISHGGQVLSFGTCESNDDESKNGYMNISYKMPAGNTFKVSSTDYATSNIYSHNLYQTLDSSGNIVSRSDMALTYPLGDRSGAEKKITWTN